MLWCDVLGWDSVVLGCGVKLHCSLPCVPVTSVQTYASDESPFSSHTLWMKLCFAGEQQRPKGPSPVVGVFVYCGLKYSIKYKTYNLCQYSDIILTLHRNFRIVSEVAYWKQQSKKTQMCRCGLIVCIFASIEPPRARSNSQSIMPFYSKVQLIFFLFLAT